MPPWLISIDQIALAGCARTPFSGVVTTGSTLNLSRDKFEFYCFFVIGVLPIFGMQHIVAPKREDADSKQQITARISVGYRCFWHPFRPQLQDFCGADEIGG
jgi:hypothetical protein